MDFEKFQASLYEFDALREGDEIQQDVVERIQPEYADSWPDSLDPRVRDTLLELGISKNKLYRHQADAIEHSLKGYNVALEAPTASGKTLSFAIPMLQTLVQNPHSHALMIYPMKALGFDQRSQIRKLCKPLGIESWTFDGDTEKEHRSLLKGDPPPILITTPETLNASFLGWRQQWQSFLCNLKFIVIDEMHEYRGLFGTHMALTLRRFFLYLRRLGVSPQVFLSTATCQNPQEHAENLIGASVKIVSYPKALQPRRKLIFVKPRIPDFEYWKRLQQRIEQAALASLANDLQVLIFCPSKRFLDDAYSKCRSKAEEMGFKKELLATFHADMTARDKQQIHLSMKSDSDDSVRVVFATNALELGLDIGGLDGVILAGFPPNVMSAWQQIGRAGRSWKSDAFVLFYAMNDPIDRFFVSNIKAFLDKPLDQLVIAPDNEELIKRHLASLVMESDGKLYPEDEAILGSAFYEIAKKDRSRPAKGFTPQYFLSQKLRGGIGRSYDLMHKNRKVGQISEMRRFREAYIGSIFTIMGRKYRVHSHEEAAIVLEDTDQFLRTAPYFKAKPYQGRIHTGKAYGDLEVYHGTVNFSLNFYGYTLVDERTGDGKFTEYTGPGLNKYNLHAFWLNVPSDSGHMPGVGAVEHMFRVGAMFVIPADRFDTSTWSESDVHDGLSTYYYENYEGGIGVARKLYEVWPTALQEGMEIATNCSCQKGCQNCIEPAKSWNLSGTDIDKQAGIALAKRLLHLAKTDPTHEFSDGRLVEI